MSGGPRPEGGDGSVRGSRADQAAVRGTDAPPEDPSRERPEPCEGPGRTPAIDAVWVAFRAAHPEVPDAYDVVAFGDSPNMAEELGLLVLHGPKRATACLLRDVEAGGEGMPRVGGHVLFTGGDGRPLGIWRTTEVRVGSLASVDEAFAWDEGEGERTRDDWLRGHRAFFARQAAAEGWSLGDDEPTVFERFELVWPPAGA